MIKKDVLENETDSEECSVGHLNNVTRLVIKKSTVCLLPSSFFFWRTAQHDHYVFINFSEAPSNVLKSSRNWMCSCHVVLCSSCVLQHIFSPSHSFFSLTVFCLACCWFREETKWIGEQKASRNCHSVWQCHPGKSLTNTWAQILLQVIFKLYIYYT